MSLAKEQKSIEYSKGLLMELSPRIGKVHRVYRKRFVLGAADVADVVLNPEVASAIEVVFEFSEIKGEKPQLFCFSTQKNPPTLNGKKFTSVAIQSGDILECAGHRYKFQVEPLNDEDEKKEQELRILEANQLAQKLPEANAVDYSPSSQLCLEVVALVGSKVLNIHHLPVFNPGLLQKVRNKRKIIKSKNVKKIVHSPQSISLGAHSGADLPYPYLRNYDSVLDFITLGSNEITLQLVPGMKAEVRTSHQDFKSAEALSVEGVAQNQSLVLKTTDFASVTMGAMSFFISFVPTPPFLLNESLTKGDPVLFKTLGASLALTIGMIIFAIKSPRPKPIEIEELPPRLATLIYEPQLIKQSLLKEMQPQAPKVPETLMPPKKVEVDLDKEPKNIGQSLQKPNPDPGKKLEKINEAPLKKQPPQLTRPQSQAKEGAGAKAKGAAGARGEKNSKNRGEPQNKAERPSPNAGKGQGGAVSQADPSQGNIELLKGATESIGNLLGSSAKVLGKSGGNLKGFGSFSTIGKGGQALSGAGTGGGGTAETLGGLASKGMGGGKIGVGLGAAGTGSGIFGGKTKVVLKSGSGDEGVVLGSIDTAALDAALQAHRDEFRLCYEREINAENSNIAGSIKLNFAIGGSSGRATEVGILASTLANANIERCVAAVIKRIQFPIPSGNADVSVTKTFGFSNRK